MTAIALALLSSLAWGTADFMGGLAARRIRVLAVLVVTQPVGLILSLAVVGASGDAPPDAGTLALAAGAGALTLAALAAYYAALGIGPIGIVAPIGALGVVIPVVAGIVEGNHPGLVQGAGIVVAVVGVVLASRAGGAAGPLSGRALLLALVAAAGFGGFLLIAHDTASTDPGWTLVAIRAGGCAGVLLAAARMGGVGPVRPAGLGTLVVIGTLELAANGSYALAAGKGELAVVSVGASLYPAVAAVLAAVLIGERLGRLQIAGVGLTGFGIAAIAAGA